MMPAPLARFLAVLGLVGLLAACAPLRQPMGDAVIPPFWQGDRMVMADGYSLRVLQWWPPAADGSAPAPPQAIVIALHGMNDHAGAFTATGEALAARGIASIAYDQRGFGDTLNRGIWPTGATLVADLEAVTDLVRQRYPAVPVVLLGSSMGGAVTLVATAGQASVLDTGTIEGVVLNAPAVWARSTMPPPQRAALWLATRIAPGWELTGDGLDIWPSDNIAMLRALAADPLALHANRVDLMAGVVDLMDRAFGTAEHIALPTLILYGENDQIIPPGPMARFLARIPKDAPVTVARFPDGYHMLLRDLGREAPITAMADWIAKRVPDRAAPAPTF